MILTKSTNEKVQINVKPTLTIPYEIFRDHLVMAKNAKTEYTTAMKITDMGDQKYRVTDWFFLKQECSWASAKWTRDGVIDLVKHSKGDLKEWFGVFHIHPGAGATVSMSMTDETTMWNWLKASNRGIFLVSNSEAAYQCILCIKNNDLKFQIPMQVDVPLCDPEHEAGLKKLLADNITEEISLPVVSSGAMGYAGGYYDEWGQWITNTNTKNDNRPLSKKERRTLRRQLNQSKNKGIAPPPSYKGLTAGAKAFDLMRNDDTELLNQCDDCKKANCTNCPTLFDAIDQLGD